jgi:hypothetical protein
LAGVPTFDWKIDTRVSSKVTMPDKKEEKEMGEFVKVTVQIEPR